MGKIKISRESAKNKNKCQEILKVHSMLELNSQKSNWTTFILNVYNVEKCTDERHRVREGLFANLYMHQRLSD